MKDKLLELSDECCDWANDLDGKSPLTVRDAYPAMMRRVLKVVFGVPRKAADVFVSTACGGGWDRLYATGVERSLGAGDYAGLLRDAVFYASDRWSWDRVLRVQWLYRQLCEKLRWEVDE